MSRIRSIKPEWLEDERIALTSSDARVLSIGLVLLADDYGNGRAATVMIAGRVFPGQAISVFESALAELVNARFVVLYEVDEQRYFSIRNWSKHQKVDKPGKPQVPAPPDEPTRAAPEKIREALDNFPETLAPDSKGRDSKGEEGRSARGAPPLPSVDPANDSVRMTGVSSVYGVELRDAIASEAERMGFERPPMANRPTYGAVAEDCVAIARKRGVKFAVVAAEIACLALTAHRDTRKEFEFCLRNAQTKAPEPQARASPADAEYERRNPTTHISQQKSYK